MNNFMRSLKALVIGMAILIVVGTAVIAVTLARRSAPSFETPPAAAPQDEGAAQRGGAAQRAGAARGSDGAAMVAGRVELPAGARVIETALDGSRIALRVALPDGTERIIVLDTTTGRRLGAVDVIPGGGAASFETPPAGSSASRPHPQDEGAEGGAGRR